MTGLMKITHSTIQSQIYKSCNPICSFRCPLKFQFCIFISFQVAIPINNSMKTCFSVHFYLLYKNSGNDLDISIYSTVSYSTN